jgi:hypothetical protein
MTDDRRTPDAAPPSPPPADTVPRYEKPVIRRYSQIKQVRPYGPVAD